eukprot:COSAG04_NODE_22853_length_348_cov_0.783133_2_plen_59_part_01
MIARIAVRYSSGLSAPNADNRRWATVNVSSWSQMLYVVDATSATAGTRLPLSWPFLGRE